MSSKIYRRFLWPGAILTAVILIGTAGYWLIGGKQYSPVDALYMTVITISTIGFGEIIDLSGNNLGRIFTMFIAVSGVGVLMYVVTNFTAFVVGGEVTDSFRRRKMEKKVSNTKNH